jgi:WD40 repeat protein
MITLPKLAWPREPYRGIEQFRFIDRPIFFERRDETRRLIRLVSIYRGTLLYGESGVGKSSVINAGFIPAMLEEGFLPERLRVQPIPGAEIVVERLALTDEGTAPFLPSRFAADDEPRTRLVFSTADIHARLGLAHEGGAPLLIFDQFEEFVTLFEEAPENREKFAEAAQAQNTLLEFFADLLRDETMPVKLLFVFREDYLAKLSKLLALVPNLRDQHVRLTFPDSSVLKKLIRGPFTSEIPPEHFGHIISEELANKLSAALDERSDGGTINLTEVQIACLSLWRDPKGESLFDATPNRAEVVQKLLEGHLTGSLDRLSAGLREPAIAILRHLVTPAGTRNIILEADLLERLQSAEKIPQTIGKRALAELTDQSRLVRKQRRNEAYFYDITSEFLVPWIRRQRALSDARIAMRKFRKRIGIAVAISAVILGAIGYVVADQYRETKAKEAVDRAQAKEREDDITRQKQELQKFVALEQRSKAGETNATQEAIDSIKNKEDTKKETSTQTLPLGLEAPPPPPAETSGAVEYVTDKLFVGHEGTVWSANYSPLGLAFALPGKPSRPKSLVLTAGHDYTARAWDLKTDDDFILRGHSGEVNYALFNPKPSSDPNNWVAATASDDGTAALWRPSEPSKPLFLTGHTGPVTGLAWSSDGNWLATTSKDKTIRIWNVDAPEKPPTVLAKHTGWVWLPTLVELGAKKSLLVTPSSDGTARLWNFPGGDACTFSAHPPNDREVLRHGAAVRRAAMDSQARWIVTAGADGNAIVWNRKTGEMLLVVTHEKAVRDVVFKPGSSLFVTASSDHTAQIWDAEKMTGVVTLKGHSGDIYSACFTPYGPGVVTVSWDRTARLWNYETKKCVAILKGHLSVLWSVEFSPSGTNFTTTSGDGTARLWDLKKIPGGEAFLPPAPSAK